MIVYQEVETLIGEPFGMNFSDRSINIDTTIRCTLECPKCQRQGLRRQGKKIPGQDISIDEIVNYNQTLEVKRNNFPDEIEGTVFKVNKIEYRNNLGLRSRSPRWAIAGKLKTQQVTT